MAIYYTVEGREFVPGEGKQARAYAQRLADERGESVDLNIEHTHVTRDPSGFVFDSEVYRRSTKKIKPKRRANKKRKPYSKRLGRKITRARKSGDTAKSRYYERSQIDRWMKRYKKRTGGPRELGRGGHLPNPPKLKRAPRKSGWIAATAVKFVTRNGKRTVLVRKPRRKR